MNLEKYKEEIEKYLLDQIPEKKPEKIYKPIRYILQNGGKRIRPILVLMSVQSFKGNPQDAMAAASALEIFHNFTLLHDDIMDKADMRRGKATVHKKWDENIAILSGDTMMILAYKMLEKYEGEIYKKLNSLLNKTAIEVCEGQQMDMDFEKASHIEVSSYLEMIRLKTAVLLGTALKFGGIIAGANSHDLEKIYSFGENLGIAFQIQDDYLDSFGDSKSFGKKIGGDIKDRKKTILFLESLKNLNPRDQQKLRELFNTDKKTDIFKEVIALYEKAGVPEIAKDWIKFYTSKAIDSLQETSMNQEYKKSWENFAGKLMHRNQ